MLQVNDPRKSGREAIQSSVPAELWSQNLDFSQRLLEMVNKHPIMQHPIIAELDAGQHDLVAQRFFHLEFRHAFAQIFTDGLICAMLTSSQLEPRLGAVGKVAARFLLQLNVLDELGFQPNAADSNDYAGNPQLSHYVQFDATLNQLGITPADLRDFRPSEPAIACRATFEGNYQDHALLATVLAISESVFTKFCGPWAKNVGAKTGIDVSDGYHSIHVEQDGKFIDDDHSEDAWYVFRQAVTPDRYEEIMNKANTWLDTWTAFLNFLAAAALSRQSLAA